MSGTDRQAQSSFCSRCGDLPPRCRCPPEGPTNAPWLESAPLVGYADDGWRIGSVVGGRYRLERLVGRGGFGAVFAAEHIGTRQTVAIKTLVRPMDGGSSVDLIRLYREAQVTAALRHPNTVRVFDVGEADNGAPYIAMELLHGPTLEQVLRQRAAAGAVLTQAEAIEVGVAILRSLSEAHAAELVHRDLKPTNVMLDEVDGERVVKVLDFGIAHIYGSSLTGSSSTLGTPAYMSPEQCLAQPLDGRSDLYALGVILFRCVTGKVPFFDLNPMTMMFAHAHQPSPDLSSLARTCVTQDFAALVMKVLAKDPNDRFASARDMRLALEAVVSDKRQAAEAFSSADLAVARGSPVAPASADGATLTIERPQKVAAPPAAPADEVRRPAAGAAELAGVSDPGPRFAVAGVESPVVPAGQSRPDAPGVAPGAPGASAPTAPLAGAGATPRRNRATWTALALCSAAATGWWFAARPTQPSVDGIATAAVQTPLGTPAPKGAAFLGHSSEPPAPGPAPAATAAREAAAAQSAAPPQPATAIPAAPLPAAATGSQDPQSDGRTAAGKAPVSRQRTPPRRSHVQRFSVD